MSFESLDLSLLNREEEEEGEEVTLKMPPARPLMVPRLAVPAVAPPDAGMPLGGAMDGALPTPSMPGIVTPHGPPDSTRALRSPGGSERRPMPPPGRPAGGRPAKAGAAGKKPFAAGGSPATLSAGDAGAAASNDPLDAAYRSVRSNRLLYADPELHCLLLELLLRLLLNPAGQIDALYHPRDTTDQALNYAMQARIGHFSPIFLHLFYILIR